jgi:cytochrome c oxidase subunit 1
LPRIRSERSAFELHYPHMVERLRDEAHVRRTRRETHHDDAVAVGTTSERRAP